MSLALICSLASPVLADSPEIPDRPEPARFVNDYANVLSPDEASALESKLLAYDQESSTQIVVMTIDSLDGYPIEMYSIEVAETWGIGQEGRDNGVLVLMSKGDREVRIEVGYGLEGAIPDVAAKRIIDGYLIPNFRDGEFFRAFDEATDQLISLSRGEFTAEDMRPVNQYHDDLAAGRTIIYVFTGFFVLTMFLMSSGSNLARFLAILATGLIVAVNAYTEYEYWPNHQTGWFWWRLILFPIPIIVIFWTLIFRVRRQEKSYERMRDLVHKSSWQRLRRLYDANAIENKRLSFAAEAEKLTKWDRKSVQELIGQINRVKDNPNDHFQRRNEADLIELQEELDRAKVFSNDLFRDEARKNAELKLKSEITYFGARSLEALTDDEKTRLGDSVAFFQLIKEDPAASLGLETQLVRARTDEWMKSIDAKFKKYRGNYTSSSIASTKKKFKAAYEKARQAGDGAHELYTFYTGQLMALVASPGKFLTKIVRSSSSGGGSYSSGSSFSSSSSFGGGSFGGGGASGSW